MSRVRAFAAGFVFTTCFTLGACCSNPPPNTVVVCQADAGPEEDFADDKSEEALALSSPCARACAVMAKFKCPESRKPPAGLTCITVCKRVEPISAFDPQCVLESKTLTELRVCPKIPCEGGVQP